MRIPGSAKWLSSSAKTATRSIFTGMLGPPITRKLVSGNSAIFMTRKSGVQIAVKKDGATSRRSKVSKHNRFRR